MMKFTDSIFFKRTNLLIQMKMESDGRATCGMNWNSHSCHRFWFGEVFNSEGFTLSVEAQPVISYWYP